MREPPLELLGAIGLAELRADDRTDRWGARHRSRHHFVDTLEVCPPGRGCIEHSVGRQDASDLAEGSVAVRHVVEHVLRDHHIDSSVLERDRLRICRDERDTTGEGGGDPAGLAEHPGGEVGEDESPLRRHAL